MDSDNRTRRKRGRRRRIKEMMKEEKQLKGILTQGRLP